MDNRTDVGTSRLAPSPRDGFEGKIALITGASWGIGRVLALSLAARGATPVIGYCHNVDAARDVVAAIERQGFSTLSIRADLESLDEIEAMFDTIEDRFGRLDFFVSNAAAGGFGPLMELTPSDLERAFNLNVRAFAVGAQRAVRLMDRGGRIVVVSSCGSHHAFPAYANLGSALAAAEDWARRLAVDLAPQGINVNVLVLGVIESEAPTGLFSPDLVASLDTVVPLIPKQRPGSIQEVADCALFLLSPASEYVTGTRIVVDGGVTATLPAYG